MTKDLKPCPFCGQAVEIEYYVINYPFTFTSNGYEITCSSCGIGFKESISRLPEFCPDEVAKAKRKLINKWNRRKRGE
jgi:Lar family restriction alleviation protein